MGYTTPSEGEGRASLVLVERLGPDCAIGTDGRQWIVLKANGRLTARYPSDGWSCVGFIHSDKRALVSCIKAKGLKLSAAGRAALDRQDGKIYRWRLRWIDRKAGACRVTFHLERDIRFDGRGRGAALGRLKQVAAKFVKPQI